MKLVRIIGLLVLAFTFWQTGTDVLAVETVGMEAFAPEEVYISTPQHPLSPVAEWGIACASGQSLVHARTLRTGSTCTFVSVKDMVARLAHRMAAHSPNINEKRSDVFHSHHCHFACEYYIFRLRRILI